MSERCYVKCRIKGHGTEALMNELHKKVTLDKGGFCHVEITPMLGPKREGRTGPDGKLVEYQVPETLYFGGSSLYCPPVIRNEQAEFWADTRWPPPVDALTILTELYEVEIELFYHIPCNRCENSRTLRFHRGKVMQVRYGYFGSVGPGQPIHHWRVECQGSTVSRIKEAGIILLNNDADLLDDNEFRVTVRDADIMQVRQVPGVELWSALTLDEKGYVLSIQTDLDWGMPRHPDGDDIKLVRAAHCFGAERSIDTLRHARGNGPKSGAARAAVH